ncbi:MAG TPA: membrane protein insertase YidC [Candidatus Cryosericum sp.]|nr:membrane protein insertase YidC [Candidatus Cryosericum sp.]
MEERRLLIAVALSLLVLTAYQFLFPTAPAPRRPLPTASGAPTSGSPGAERSPAPGPSARVTASPAASPTSASVTPVADALERRVEAQGEEVAVAFSNRGARLVSWQLKRYRDAKGRPEEMVQNIPGGPRALDVETGDPDVDPRLRDALFQPSAEVVTLAGSGETELRFHWAEGEIEATKTLRFRGPGYLVRVEAEVKKAGRPLPVKVIWGPGLGNPTPEEMEVQGYHAPQGVSFGPRGVERLVPDKIGPQHPVTEVRWAGVESTHFAALWVPPVVPGTVELRAIELPAGEDGRKKLGVGAAVPLGGSGDGGLLFVGPKDHGLLTALDHDLAAVVPVGEWIGPIVIPLMALLRWVHGWVGNYGWSIVVLTVLINVIMAPLRHYSIANGIKMAKLSPEMRVIQERYRKVPALDPKRQEMQQEIAALYERHGMSMSTQMLVGCLPLLLTMPFLIAFYRVLQVAIELRGASFLWIPDLSQRDPLFITPVLMGISMFVMQRMTPTAMDPAQQRIMMIMPVVLVVMFHAAPAGLNLYWLSSNLCSVVQQAVTMRIIASPADRAQRKERRRP